MAILVVLVLTASASADDGWTPLENGWSRYTNGRFGTVAELPLHLFRLVEPPPENGDGRAFEAGDGARLQVYGGYGPHTVTDGFAEYKAWLLEGAALDRITYQAEGKTWLVFSGWKGSNIVYRKVTEGCGAAHELHIEYPAAKRSVYAAVVARISRSLGCIAGSASGQ